MGTDIHGVFQKKTQSGWEDIDSNYEEDRHYLLFAWLGGVRNGFGFAGIKTHSPFKNPVAEGRGLPKDFDVDDFEYHNNYWMGEHSHSWAGGEEILNHERPTVIRTGIVPLEFYRTWDKRSSPNEWSGGIGGPGIQVNDLYGIDDKTTHVQIHWASDASDEIKYFIDEVQRLIDMHGNIRFVFGFDS